MNLSLELLAAANRAEEPNAWLAAALPAIAAEMAAAYAALAAADGGRWNVVAESGASRSPPVELLADALDRETPQARGNWVAAPLAPRGGAAEALLLCWAAASPSDALTRLALIAPIVRDSLASVRLRDRQVQRVRRLETVLEIASQWNQTARDRTAPAAYGRGGYPLAEGRSGEYLSLGPHGPLSYWPAGLGG